jgi:hypothetical protein
LCNLIGDIPRQQLIELVGAVICDAFENVSQIGFRIEAITTLMAFTFRSIG